MSELIERSDEAEEPSEKRANGDRGEAVPKKEHKNAAFSDRAFFPGDFGVEDISKDSGKAVRNN